MFSKGKQLKRALWQSLVIYLDGICYFMSVLQRSSYMILPGGPVNSSCQTFGSLKLINFNVKLQQTPKKKIKHVFVQFCRR